MREINDEISGFGNLSYSKKIDIAAPQDAVIVSLFFREGDEVRKGEKIAVLVNPQITLAALEAQEKEISSGLDEELLFKFDRIIRNKMGKGIVAIKGGVCAGCHMKLPAQFANRVHKGEETLFCPYCSRILFYEESEQAIEQEDYFDGDTAGSLSDLEGLEEEEEEEEEKVSMDFDE